MFFNQLRKGFSLLELILVLGVGSMVAFMKFQDMKNEQDKILASAVGQQINQIGVAVNSYINIRYDKLAGLTNATGNGTDPGPRICTGSICEITYQTLVNEGLLPSSYTGINAFRSSYKIILKRDGIAPNYLINGVVTTSASWAENGSVRYDLLGKAMQIAGIDSGMTKTSTTVNGYNGQWNETSANFTNITSSGQLAYRVGYNSALYSVYLRRDGTLPMTGDLNMGGNNIYNVKDITSTGNLKVGGTSTLSGNVTTGGNLTTGGTISAFSDVTSGGNIFAKSGISTNGNMYALGDIAVGSPGTPTSAPVPVAYMSASEGSLYAKNIIKTDGDITASGSLKANTLLATSTTYYGASCTATGTMSKDSTGNPLFCSTDNKWIKPNSVIETFSQNFTNLPIQTSGMDVACIGTSNIGSQQQYSFSITPIQGENIFISFTASLSSSLSPPPPSSPTETATDRRVSSLLAGTGCIYINNELCSGLSNIGIGRTGTMSCVKGLIAGQTYNFRFVLGNNYDSSVNSRFFNIQYVRTAR